jgi:hypothetical protein
MSYETRRRKSASTLQPPVARGEIPVAHRLGQIPKPLYCRTIRSQRG